MDKVKELGEKNRLAITNKLENCIDFKALHYLREGQIDIRFEVL